MGNMGVRNTLMSLAQRTGSIPNRLARALTLLVTLLLIYLMLCWRMPTAPTASTAPSKERPYATDLVLKTTELGVGVKPKPSGNYHAFPANGSAHGAQPSSKHVMDCSPDIRALREIRDRYKLDDEIEHMKRYVRFTRKPIERPSYTVLQQSFLPDNDVDRGFRFLHLSRDHDHGGECHEPLEVPVPQSRFPADVDLSDFLFAMSTTFARLNRSTAIQEWAHWLTDGHGRSNGGRLLLRLVDASELEVRSVARRLADVGIDAEVGSWDGRREKEMAVRYFNMVQTLFTHEGAATRKWFVMCDDDTFFTAMNSLVAKFKEFDHTKPLYIGTLSEDIDAVKLHGSQAFGGGGVFLSRALAKIVSSVHESCKTQKKIDESNSGWGPQGDILLRKCIYENTDVRLMQLPELWQLDIAGDPSGFYESGLKPFSVHHFGSPVWHIAYPLNSTKIAHTCGEDCPYQRFLTKDNFVISNGYSIAQYPDGIDFHLGQVERTFHALHEDWGWNFDFTFGPQRPSLHGTGKKVAWELRESQVLEDGAVSQVYIRKSDDGRWVKDGKRMKALDGIIELVWIPK